MVARADQNGPNPIDLHVGLRIRTVRRERAMSQDVLAEALGITFQQIQKYERGTNRVSASMLVKAARALGCSAGDLLPSSEHTTETHSLLIPAQLMELITRVRGMEELIHAFGRIASEEEREELIRLAAILAKREA